MNNTGLLMLFTSLFELLWGLTPASPVSLSPAITDSRSLDHRAPLTPAARRDDDDHLCYGLTKIGYEYGNQPNQNGTISDCDKLLKHFYGLTGVQSNITNFCGGPVPGNDSDVKPPAGFDLLGSQGNCALWSQCFASETQIQVAFGYGDIADVLKLATDGLKSSGPGTSKNSSIVSVRASTECQTLKSNWFVAFDGSEPGRVS